MLPHEILRQIRRLQIRSRRAVLTNLGGEYHSAFKGMGLSFDEVREYQPGDDVRRIDWNVTARMGSPFIKRYIEERELTVLLAVDFSASLNFGTGTHRKRSVAGELAALLAFCAVGNHDRVGLVGFTTEIERSLRPTKGTRHILRLLRDVLFFEPEHRGTDLAKALDYLCRIQRRRAIVFVLSDFLTPNCNDAFRRAARKHDLIAVRIRDDRERTWPDAGLIHLRDAETGDQRLIDTSSKAFRREFAVRAEAQSRAFESLAQSAAVDLIDVDTGGNHLDALMNFFRRRERRRSAG